jgi:hypothetical protein
MEGMGIISGYDGSKARNVLVTEEQLPGILTGLRGTPPAADAGGSPATHDTP